MDTAAPVATSAPTPAPSAPVATEPKVLPVTSAAEAAIASGDTRAFRDAKRAERAGQPLPVPAAVEAAQDAEGDAAPAIDGQPQKENRKTRAEREQERINETIRTAVAAAEAKLRAELAPPREAAQPAADAPPADQIPTWKQFASLPDAPKLGQFDSVEEHTAAMATFVAEKMLQARDAASAHQQQTAAQASAAQAEVDTFLGRLDEAKKADPEFATKLSADVKALKPFGALTPGEVGGPSNVVAAELMKSPEAARLLLHLSTPGELAKLTTVPQQIAAMPEGRAKIAAHIAHIRAEIHRLEGRLAAAAAPSSPTAHITAAPDPAETLGSRPTLVGDAEAQAIKRGDTRAYRELKRQQRAASFGHARG